MSSPDTPGAGLRALGALAALKVFLGIVLYAGAFATRWADLGPRSLLMFAHVLMFGVTGGFLVGAGRSDRRVALLGTALLLTAAAFADNARLVLETSTQGLFPPVRWVMGLQPDAYTAWVLWAFVSVFPRVPAFGARHRIPQAATRLALVISTVLFVANVAYHLIPAGTAPVVSGFIAPLVRDVLDATPIYWLVQYTFTIAALAVMVWKAKNAALPERRRTRLLTFALLAGVAPTVAYVVIESVWPPFRSIAPMRLAGWILYPTLLALPVAAAWAVLVDEALETRVILRRAAQYAMARYTLIAAASIPLVLLVLTVYRQRSQPVGELVTGVNGVLLGLLIILAIVVARGRTQALEALDRRFFREHYDSRRILSQLVEECRSATSRTDLATILAREIDRALHPQALGVLVRESRQFVTRAGDMRPLSLETRLAHALRDAESLDIDFERPAPSMLLLADSDRHWLLDTATRLLVPLRDVDREVIGVIALADKRSELPYTQEDRHLLAAVAAAASLSLAYLSVSSRPESSGGHGAISARVAEGPAMECIECGQISELDGGAPCATCGGSMVAGSLPAILAGKFRVVQRIGAGGMGVVYRGMDLTLHRAVAIKALPEIAPDHVVKLRREARHMATVTHPNLALLYGSESWNGAPILIEEYLAGGTLEHRLTSGALPVDEVIAIGVALGDAVASLHGAGLLHRDIKPSNIGFQSDGTVKLLDFGLARLLPEAMDRHFTEEQAILRRTTSEHLMLAIETSEGRVPGTPLYLSPEAIGGAVPDPAFDLWSLSVVLYEAIAGRHPAQEPSPVRTLVRIATGESTDLAEVVPDVHPDVAAFFRRALHREPDARFRTATAFRDALQQLPRSPMALARATSSW